MRVFERASNELKADRPLRYAVFSARYFTLHACGTLTHTQTPSHGDAVWQCIHSILHMCHCFAHLQLSGHSETPVDSREYFSHCYGLDTLWRDRFVYDQTFTLIVISDSMIASLPLYLPRPSGEIYGISGLSCGVRDIYPKSMFLFHLLPVRNSFLMLKESFLISPYRFSSLPCFRPYCIRLSFLFCVEPWSSGEVSNCSSTRTTAGAFDSTITSVS